MMELLKDLASLLYTTVVHALAGGMVALLLSQVM